MPSLSLPQLRELIKLTEKREALQGEIKIIESQIASTLAQGQFTTPTATKLKTLKRKRKRGSIKHSILAELKAAGKHGVTIRNLAAKLGLKNQNVHVWFATTGKSVEGLRKKGPGHYALS